MQHYEWWYTNQFNITESIKDQVVEMLFEGVDFSCDVWLNGYYLGHHEGVFTPFSFDVGQYMRISSKNLASTNMLIIRLNTPPQVNALVAGRKAPWFGDYWRDLIPIGITRPIKIVSTGKVRFEDVYANNTLNADGSSDVIWN